MYAWGVFHCAIYDGVVRSLRKASNSCLRPGVQWSRCPLFQFLRPQTFGITSVLADKISLHPKCRMDHQPGNTIGEVLDDLTMQCVV